MYNLILADIYKLRRTMAIKILFGITTASAVAMAVIAYLIPQGKLGASMSGIGFMFSDINIISILGGVIAGIFVCGDFDNKVIHDSVASGCSRGAVVFSKLAVFCCTIVFLLLPYAIITAFGLVSGSKFSVGSVSIGFLHLITFEGGVHFSGSEIWKLLAVMLTLIIVYMAQLSICVLLALVLKKPVPVIAIYYGFSILCGQLTKLSDSSAVFNRIFSLTPYGGSYSFITLSSRTEDIFKAILVSLIFMLVMLAVSQFAFRKAEIK